MVGFDRGYDPQGRKIIRDFLEPNWPTVDNIVTNSPFDLFENFVHQPLNAAYRWLRSTPLRRPAALDAARACYLEGREAGRRHTRLLLARLGARVQRDIRTILAY